MPVLGAFSFAILVVGIRNVGLVAVGGRGVVFREVVQLGVPVRVCSDCGSRGRIFLEGQGLLVSGQSHPRYGSPLSSGCSLEPSLTLSHIVVVRYSVWELSYGFGEDFSIRSSASWMPLRLTAEYCTTLGQASAGSRRPPAAPFVPTVQHPDHMDPLLVWNKRLLDSRLAPACG